MAVVEYTYNNGQFVVPIGARKKCLPSCWAHNWANSFGFMVDVSN